MTTTDIKTAVGTPRGQRADARRNRAKVLVSAQKLFAEQGLDAQIDEIARDAGVGVGTVYRHFPTKEDLLQALADERFVGLAQAGDPVGGGGEQHPVALPGGGDAEGAGQVGLAGAGRAEEDDVAVLGQVGPRSQGLDGGPRGGLLVEVEVLDRLDRGHPGGPDT